MKKFARLTYNSNNWLTPSGHQWKKSNQKKKGISYENRYGYGHEEWLFNPNFQKDGYQYGFIQGLTLKSIDFFEEVHLYTVQKVNGRRFVFYLGFIKNVEGILNNEEIQEEIAPSIFDPYFDKMISDIEAVNADPSKLIETGYYFASVRFKVSDINLKSEPVLLPNFNLTKYKRFIAYNLNDDFLKQVNFLNVGKNGFKTGKSKQNISYGRNVTKTETTIEKLHSIITDSLETYLKPEFSLRKKNLSIEFTRFNNCIADVVTLSNKNQIDIYEIKTSFNIRKNIRESLSQLLDYAVHSQEKVKNLYIVSPAPINDDAKVMLKKLNDLIDYPIFYLYYSDKNKTIEAV